jgi:hypothetical protein
MDAIFCNGCGAKLEEAPTLLPDQRLPCPTCGSLARRFEQDITEQVTLSDSGTSADTFTVTRTIGLDAVVHAQTATLEVDAMPATVIPHSIPSAEEFGVPTIREARHVTDQLVVMGRLLEWIPLTGHLAGMSRSLWWVQLSEQPTWLVQVVDESGELLDFGIELENNQIEALAGVAKHLLTSDDGPMLLMVMDQAGKVLAISAKRDSTEALASAADTLLPKSPWVAARRQRPA